MAARRTLRRCATTRARDRRGTSRRTRAESMLRAGKRVALGNLPALRPSWRQRTQTVQRAGSVSCCSENHVGCLSSRRLGTLCLRFSLMLSFPYYNAGQELPGSPRTTAVHPVPGVATARRTRTDPAAASNSGAWRPVRTGTSQKGVQSYGVPPERHYSFKADANYSDTCDHSGQCS